MIAFPPKNWTKKRLNFAQQLMTAEQARKIPPLYSQDGKGMQATVYIKFFAGGLTWLATEFDPEEGMFFGFTINHRDPDCSEFGYFSAEEICSRPYPQRGRNSAGQLTIIPAIERDLHFKPCTLLEACKANGYTPQESPPAIPAAVSDDGTLEFYKSDFA